MMSIACACLSSELFFTPHKHYVTSERHSEELEVVLI